MIGPAYLQHSSDEVIPSKMLLESCPKVIEQKGVFMARSLMNRDSHKIPVRVLNPLDEEKRLYREIILGLGSQIKKTEVVNSKAQSVGTKIASDGLLPDHVQTLWNEYKNVLSLTEQIQVKNLIEYSDVFVRSKADLGKTSVFQHRINTGTPPPIKQRPRRIPISNTILS